MREIKLFRRWFVTWNWATNELWGFNEDGQECWYLFDVSMVKRTYQDIRYKGLQFVILRLHLVIVDTHTVETLEPTASE